MVVGTGNHGANPVMVWRTGSHRRQVPELTARSQTVQLPKDQLDLALLSPAAGPIAATSNSIGSRAVFLLVIRPIQISPGSEL